MSLARMIAMVSAGVVLLAGSAAREPSPANPWPGWGSLRDARARITSKEGTQGIDAGA